MKKQPFNQLLVLLIFFIACKKDNTPSIQPIQSISPDNGFANTRVTIIGKSFGDSLLEHIVQFNGQEAPVVKKSGDTLWAEVPLGAGTGNVTVTANGKWVTGPVFTYKKQLMVLPVAGSGVPGTADGSANAAQFFRPEGITSDAAGNLYVSDTYNHLIRKITPGGTVTTIAGSSGGHADGMGQNAKLWMPQSCVMDPQGNLFIADAHNHRIRSINPAGMVADFAGSTFGSLDGSYLQARFSYPSGLALDKDHIFYVADQANHRIRKIDGQGKVTTIAGNGQGFQDGDGALARFYMPFQVAVNNEGVIYVSDKGNHCVRKITAPNTVTVLAGDAFAGMNDGTGTAAKFRSPSGIAIDSVGNIYVADTDNHRIRKITAGGIVTTVAGGDQGNVDGPVQNARFSYPMAITIDRSGIIYVTDKNNRVRKIESK